MKDKELLKRIVFQTKLGNYVWTKEIPDYKPKDHFYKMSYICITTDYYLRLTQNLRRSDGRIFHTLEYGMDPERRDFFDIIHDGYEETPLYELYGYLEGVEEARRTKISNAKPSSREVNKLLTVKRIMGEI
jgi:hypothetical protein